ILVIRRYLLPPMLNIVQEPTGSAWGKSALVSARLFHSAWSVIFHQSSRGWRASGCFSQNSRKGLLLMICNLDAPSASYALKLRISCQVLVSCHGLQMKTLAAVLPCGRSPQEKSC